ncbi:Radh flavin-dependent halogenase [Mycena venus]|uniref:Radh flavin-dependent halogenase n=1 Tax=Mycena venus TaxID=2733690 RepID=A0A8H7CEW4_9AGAR|nr:Radh flavin-dependent halogenase [Mycena venus]
MHADVPSSTEILVIGGGPAGAYAACTLAREGFRVVLLEKDHFPRYHIGESMLASIKGFLRFIGAEEKVANHGFTVKVGGAVKLNQHKREGYTDFISPDPTKAAWNVVRSEFDEILLRHAAECGVCVCEGVQVNGIEFSSGVDERPVSAEWKSDLGVTQKLDFKWLIDASGRAGIMSTKYLKNRKFNQALKNIAFWGYWTGAGSYGIGTSRENAPWFEALKGMWHETGWAWFIPLHNGTVSVGVVLNEEASRKKKAALEGPEQNKIHYLTQLRLAPGVMDLLGGAILTTEIKSAGDYSYSATYHAGPNFRIVGDAGGRVGFSNGEQIDPFFSSGVHLAFAGGLSAAASIAASIRGHCTEADAIQFHNDKVGTSYTRFLIAVLSIYRQINAQAAPVLSDIDEDNFDRAFDFLRPVIQGSADIDKTVTEDILQRTMDFCEHAMAPTTSEMHAGVAARMGPSLVAADGPVMGVEQVAALAGKDEEAKQVLWAVNARKAVGGLVDWERTFESGNLRGLSIVLERAKLGLRRIEVN